MYIVIALISLAVRILFLAAILCVSYTRGKGKSTKELLLACLPIGVEKTKTTLAYWLVALSVYHIPTLLCHLVVCFFRAIGTQVVKALEPVNPRKGITLED